MQQNLPVQDQSFKSDSECDKEAEDTTILIDEEDRSENLENEKIPEPQQLSETVQNDTGEPLVKKPKLSEDFLTSRKQQKLFQRFLAQPKMLCYMKNFKKIQQKIQVQDTTKNTS